MSTKSFHLNFESWMENFPEENKSKFNYEDYFEVSSYVDEERSALGQGIVKTVNVLNKKDNSLYLKINFPNDFELINLFGIYQESNPLFFYCWAVFFLNKRKDPNYPDFEKAVLNHIIYKQIKKDSAFNKP